jgi:amidase
VASLSPFDVVVLPTYMSPAIRVGEYAQLSPEETLQRIIEWISPCPGFNVSGQPAIAIPTGFTPEGLPVGVQLVGKPASEATLIALAAQLEALQPWENHRPPMAI